MILDEQTRRLLSRPDHPSEKPRHCFTTTHWTVVLSAGGGDSRQASEALEKLCRAYWFPLYAYIRRRGHAPEDAEDLAQAFFAQLLEKRWLDGVQRNGRPFRSFLLAALNGFLANQYDRATAMKRGGKEPVLSLDVGDAERLYSQEPARDETPERMLDRRWALAVLGRALTRLSQETTAAGKVRQWEQLSPFLSREPEAGEYAAVAADLGMSTGTVGVAVHRLRQRYREQVRAEIAETLADPAQLDAEMSELFAALSD